MKTYLGWVLARAADRSWTFTPPDGYRDPEPADAVLGEHVFIDPRTGQQSSQGCFASPADGFGADPPAAGRRSFDQRGERDQQLALAGAAGPEP